MKLESKLGISTGVLILAMFVSAPGRAHARSRRPTASPHLIFNERSPSSRHPRGPLCAMMTSVRSLETYLLIGADDPNPPALRKQRLDDLMPRSAPRPTPRSGPLTTISAAMPPSFSSSRPPRPAPPRGGRSRAAERDAHARSLSQARELFSLKILSLIHPLRLAWAPRPLPGDPMRRRDGHAATAQLRRPLHPVDRHHLRRARRRHPLVSPRPPHHAQHRPGRRPRRRHRLR